MEVRVTVQGSDISMIEIALSGKLETDEISANKIAGHVAHVTLDLTDLKVMNSIGIRAFMLWMRQFEDRKVVLKNCPKFFIDQINMVQGLVPAHAMIESFFVPYFSEKSSETFNVLYRRGTEFVRDKNDFLLKHPRVSDRDGNDCELDVPEFKFFAFLRRFP